MQIQREHFEFDLFLRSVIYYLRRHTFMHVRFSKNKCNWNRIEKWCYKLLLKYAWLRDHEQLCRVFRFSWQFSRLQTIFTSTCILGSLVCGIDNPVNRENLSIFSANPEIYMYHLNIKPKTEELRILILQARLLLINIKCIPASILVLLCESVVAMKNCFSDQTDKCSKALAVWLDACCWWCNQAESEQR